MRVILALAQLLQGIERLLDEPAVTDGQLSRKREAAGPLLLVCHRIGGVRQTHPCDKDRLVRVADRCRALRCIGIKAEVEDVEASLRMECQCVPVHMADDVAVVVRRFAAA